MIDFPTEKRDGVADHELYLSFTNDEDAEKFMDWLYDSGFELFRQEAE